MISSVMRLAPPDLNAKRTQLADWIELLALADPRGRVSSGAVRTLLRLATNDRTRASDLDADADASGDPEVTERAADDLEERTADELSYRAKTIGEAYPFVIEPSAGGRSVSVQTREGWDEPEKGWLIYAFCLLDSGIREGLISKPRDAQPLVDAIGNMFQICSCIAIGGYTGFDVLSFGFPRATGDAFLPALKAVWEKYGNYAVIDAAPHGFDKKLQDGGIDVIAWRAFGDGHSATLLLFAQVASGLNWKNKSVVEDVRGIKIWFQPPHFEHFTPAICIPFPLWFDLEEPVRDKATGRATPYGDGIRTRFATREPKFGVIFDRGRIAQASAVALAPDYPRRAAIDGIDRIGEISDWVGQVVGRMREAA